MTRIPAIPTIYKEIQMKSRLEARIARRLDEYRIRWVYEAEGFQLGNVWYVPDFWLPDYNIFIEGKGVIDEESVAKPFRLAHYLKYEGKYATEKNRNGIIVLIVDSSLGAHTVDLREKGEWRLLGEELKIIQIWRASDKPEGTTQPHPEAREHREDVYTINAWWASYTKLWGLVARNLYWDRFLYNWLQIGVSTVVKYETQSDLMKSHHRRQANFSSFRNSNHLPTTVLDLRSK